MVILNNDDDDHVNDDVQGINQQTFVSLSLDRSCFSSFLFCFRLYGSHSSCSCSSSVD